jgi:FkbM family methyltransferase
MTLYGHPDEDRASCGQKLLCRIRLDVEHDPARAEDGRGQGDRIAVMPVGIGFATLVTVLPPSGLCVRTTVISKASRRTCSRRSRTSRDGYGSSNALLNNGSLPVSARLVDASLVPIPAAIRNNLFAFAGFLDRRRSSRRRDLLFAITLRLAQPLGPPVVVDIDGFTFELDLRDGVCRSLWANRTFSEGHILSTLCQAGDVVIDAGANVGDTALIAARAVGPIGRVVAIEPAERPFSVLKKNAERNFPDRITPLRAACDEIDGTVTLFASDWSAQNSLRPGLTIGIPHREVVQARSLASLCQELGITPDLVKIDVEGAEWRVLKGLLERGGPRPRKMLVEVYKNNSEAFGYMPSTLCAWLREQGYDLSLSRGTEQFEYSDERADGPLVHDVIAIRSESRAATAGSGDCTPGI